MVSNTVWGTFMGVASAVNGYVALDNLLDAANIKAAALQNALANAPEATTQVYQIAHEVGQKLAQGHTTEGLFFAAVTAISSVGALHYTLKKD